MYSVYNNNNNNNNKLIINYDYNKLINNKLLHACPLMTYSVVRGGVMESYDWEMTDCKLHDSAYSLHLCRCKLRCIDVFRTSSRLEIN